MPHLNQQALVYDAHPEVEEYPYDFEAYEVVSKSCKRVGKLRTIEGYICSLNRFGRRIHQQKNEKLKYIAFFPSETPILNFLSRHFRGYKRDYFFQNPYRSKI